MNARRKHISSAILVRLFTLAPLFACTQLAPAAVKTWDGGGGKNYWITPDNWDSDTAPVAGDLLVFPAGAARLTNQNFFSVGTAFEALVLSGQNYDLSGYQILLSTGIDASAASGPNYVRLPLKLASSQVFTSDSAVLHISGPIDLNGWELAIGAGNFDFHGGIAGAGKVTKSASGQAAFRGTNTFSGALQVLAGSLAVHDAAALGTSSGDTTVGAGAAVWFPAAVVTSESFVIAGTIGSESGPGATFNGTIALTGDAAELRGAIAANGVISGTGFTKTGPEALILNANNTYIGTTLIRDGGLEVNGQQPASPIVLSGNGTFCSLRGSGRVGSVTTGGTSVNLISPGGFGAGILYCGTLSLGGSALVSFELDGTVPGVTHDQLNVSGSVTLGNASLTFTLGYPPDLGDMFVLINNDGTDAVAGTFKNLPEGHVVAQGAALLRITYQGGDGNDVVLARIPGPPRLTAVVPLAGGVKEIRGLGAPNLVHTIEAAENLGPGVTWAILGSSVAGSDGVFTFPDTNAPVFQKRFYRAFYP